MNERKHIIEKAVKESIKQGRSFHDFWYYTLDHLDRMRFAGFQEFDKICSQHYHAELLRLEKQDAERSAATEAYWKEKQGDEYGSY